MCVVALAVRAHPRWQLVVAGNRDEFHARASAPLAPWDDAPHVLAGRDLVSGGGWIGVSQAGRFAVVTNVAGHPRGAGAPSRGALVADFLRTGTVPPETMFSAFGGFSMMSVAGVDAAFRTNQPAPAHAPLTPGFHGISNGPLDPPWPRTQTLTRGLRDWIDADRPAEHLFDQLADEVPASGAARPVFIRDPVYGTRCSTIIAVDAQGAGVIIERRFAPSGAPDGETRLAFRWPRLPA